MKSTFDRLHRQLGRVTFGLLLVTLTSYGVALFCALLGISQAATSFSSVSGSLAYVSLALLIAFLGVSLIGSFIRWLDRRGQSKKLPSI